MWKIFSLIFALYIPLIETQFEFPELPDFPDFEFPELPEFPEFDFPFDFNDFEFPCECKQAHCDCCLEISLIDLKGCLRVTYKNNRIRVSAIYNDVDLGGFSTAFPIPANTGVTLQLPCFPGATLQLRARNRRSRRNRRRFCIDGRARASPRRVFFNRDVCFDINGNALTTIGNN